MEWVVGIIMALLAAAAYIFRGRAKRLEGELAVKTHVGRKEKASVKRKKSKSAIKRARDARHHVIVLVSKGNKRTH